MNIIRVKIDVTKIDKARLFVGKKGTYLDATLLPTPDNQYGDDYMIVQDVGKEAREAGEKGAILGNAREVQSQQQQQQPTRTQPEVGCPDADSEVPF